MDLEKVIIEKCLEARKNSYVPYSNFAVGAALITEDDTIYMGCNIENAAYSATICAERTTIFKAVSEGHTHIKAIAIAGGIKGYDPVDYTYPCGTCRQVMWEFGDENTKVYIAISKDKYEVYPLTDLIPHGFKSETLNKK